MLGSALSYLYRLLRALHSLSDSDASDSLSRRLPRLPRLARSEDDSVASAAISLSVSVAAAAAAAAAALTVRAFADGDGDAPGDGDGVVDRARAGFFGAAGNSKWSRRRHPPTRSTSLMGDGWRLTETKFRGRVVNRATRCESIRPNRLNLHHINIT